jgi:hypothetical protein
MWKVSSLDATDSLAGIGKAGADEPERSGRSMSQETWLRHLHKPFSRRGEPSAMARHRPSFLPARKEGLMSFGDGFPVAEIDRRARKSSVSIHAPRSEAPGGVG